jgi:hypothetical protein
MPAQEKQEQAKPKEEIAVERSSEKRKPERVLFSWKAPARPFKRRDREFWVSVIAISALVGFIFYVIEGIMPVLLLISIVFLFYVLSTVPPEQIEYKVTSWGVRIADKRTDWNLISKFWFSKRFESDLLIFGTLTLPGRVELVINIKDKSTLNKTIASYVPEEETPPTKLDRAANWVANKLPGNK